jgi:hypothetical protein
MHFSAVVVVVVASLIKHVAGKVELSNLRIVGRLQRSD